MHFKNTSRYPHEEVCRLIQLGMDELDTSSVAVNVKNSRLAYRGRAYLGVPRCSPFARVPELDRLVTIGIGRPEQFPCDNMVARVRWIRLRPGERPSDDTPLRRCRRRVRSGWETWFERAEIVRHPYGGKSSPHIQLADWREALVAVAAHEGRHLWQYRHELPRSEVDCERYAAVRLEAYRRST